MWPMLLALAVLVLVAACDRPRGNGEASPTPQPSTNSDTVPSVIADPGTQAEVTIDESPLATWDPSSVDAFQQEGIEPGILDITERCVLLILESGDKVLPVWPEPTAWNPATQMIEFVSPVAAGETTELQGGDRIGLGGSTLTGTFSLFVTRPNPDCEDQAITTFIVSEIQTDSTTSLNQPGNPIRQL